LRATLWAGSAFGGGGVVGRHLFVNDRGMRPGQRGRL
jgi:hypothetical protein